MVEAYRDLPEQEQEELKDIQVYCGYRTSQGYTQDTFFSDHINTDNPIDLVYTNNLGRTGLFFPFYQILGMRSKTDKFWDMKDHKDISDEELIDYNWTRNSFFIPTMQKLRQHVEQEKYTYHHDWEDGDIVISEQWLSIHKRWPFEDMKNRLLHRIAFGYENL
jgi:alpha-ketoglutarate-dependent taurine dioxygenase